MASDSLLLFFLEDPNAVSADGHRDADHRLEQFHGDLFLRLVDLHHAGLLSFERPGDQLDDIALHDAADDGLRGEVCLDFRERDTGRLSLAFHDAAGPPESADDLLQAVGIHALDVDIAAEVRRDEDREHADVFRLGPRVDRVGHRAFVTDRDFTARTACRALKLNVFASNAPGSPFEIAFTTTFRRSPYRAPFGHVTVSVISRWPSAMSRNSFSVTFVKVTSHTLSSTPYSLTVHSGGSGSSEL